MKKIIVLSVIFLALLGCSLYFGISNYTKLKKVNTNHDEVYEEAYNQAFVDKKEYIKLINDYKETSANLNAQISNLQKLNQQLSSTNELNVNTIRDLNNQITNLNNQIYALNARIGELQKSLNYYETYINSLETSGQVVATFEYDSSVYAVQVVASGSKLSVTTPENTTYKIFNGWTVNGETIDLNTYTITVNTKIIADITYKYDVKFMVTNDGIINSQIVTQNEYATVPTAPTTDIEHYEFKGWSIDGLTVIDVANYQIKANTTFIAIFGKETLTVQFMIGELYTDHSVPTFSVWKTVEVEYGSLVQKPVEPDQPVGPGVIAGSQNFLGWVTTYDINDCDGYLYDFSSTVTGDLILYAYFAGNRPLK